MTVQTNVGTLQMGGSRKNPLTLTPMSKKFDTRTNFDPGCITFTMIPNFKLLHELELTWSFYIVVDLHYGDYNCSVNKNVSGKSVVDFKVLEEFQSRFNLCNMIDYVDCSLISRICMNR